MRGPSSSHTAGAYRIGLVVRELIGGEPRGARVMFDPDGSMAPTYEPLGVDLAFTAGLMGWSMLDEDYFEAGAKALAEGGDIPDRTIYVCSVCGNTIIGEAPDSCPVCGATKDKFNPVE